MPAPRANRSGGGTQGTQGTSSASSASSSSGNGLLAVTTRLGSDRVKERKAGLDQLLDLLSSPSDTARLDSHSWTRLLTAVCRFADVERRLVAAKADKASSTSTTSSAASLVASLKVVAEAFARTCANCLAAAPSVAAASGTMLIAHILSVLEPPSRSAAATTAASHQSMVFAYAQTLNRLLRTPQIRNHVAADTWQRLYAVVTTLLVPGSRESGVALSLSQSTSASSIASAASSAGSSSARSASSSRTGSPITVRSRPTPRSAASSAASSRSPTPFQDPDGSTTQPSADRARPDRRPESSELAEALAALLLVYPRANMDAPDVLRILTVYIGSHGIESPTIATMLAIVVHVVVQVAADQLDVLLEILDQLMPRVLDLWECRSPVLKQQLLYLCRLFLEMNAASASKPDALRSIYHRMAGLVISDLSFRLSPAAGDLILDAILRQSPAVVLGSLESQLNHSRSVPVDVPLLEIDTAARLLIWQLETLADADDADTAAQCRVPTDQQQLAHKLAMRASGAARSMNTTETPTQALSASSSSSSLTGGVSLASFASSKRFRRSVPLLANEIDAAFSTQTQPKAKAVLLQVLAVAATMDWRVCEPLVFKHCHQLLPLLTAGNTFVEEAAIALLHAALLRAPDVGMQSTGQPSTLASLPIQDIWDTVLSRLSHSSAMADARIAILIAIMNRQLLPTDKLISGYTALLSCASTLAGDRRGSRFELQLHCKAINLFRQANTPWLASPAPTLATMRALWSTDCRAVTAEQIHAISLTLIAQLVGVDRSTDMAWLRSPASRAGSLPGNAVLLERRFVDLMSILGLTSVSDSLSTFCSHARSLHDSHKHHGPYAPPLPSSTHFAHRLGSGAEGAALPSPSVSSMLACPAALEKDAVARILSTLDSCLKSYLASLPPSLSSNAETQQHVLVATVPDMRRTSFVLLVMLKVLRIAFAGMPHADVATLISDASSDTAGQLITNLSLLANEWCHYLAEALSSDSAESSDVLKDVAGWLEVLVQGNVASHLLWPLGSQLTASLVEAVISSAGDGTALADHALPPTDTWPADEDGSTSSIGAARPKTQSVALAGVMMEMQQYGGPLSADSSSYLVRLQVIRQTCREALLSGVLGSLAVAAQTFIESQILASLDPRALQLDRTRQVLALLEAFCPLFNAGFVCDTVDAVVSLLGSPRVEKCEMFMMFAMDAIAGLHSRAAVLSANAASRTEVGDAANTDMDDIHAAADQMLLIIKYGLRHAATFSLDVQLSLNRLLLDILVHDPEQAVLSDLFPAQCIVDLLQPSSVAFRLAWAMDAAPRIFAVIDAADYDQVGRDIVSRLSQTTSNQASRYATTAVLFAAVLATDCSCAPVLNFLLGETVKAGCCDVSFVFEHIRAAFGFETLSGLIRALLPGILGDADSIPLSISVLQGPTAPLVFAHEHVLADCIDVIYPSFAGQDEDVVLALGGDASVVKAAFGRLYGSLLPRVLALDESASFALDDLLAFAGFADIHDDDEARVAPSRRKGPAFQRALANRLMLQMPEPVTGVMLSVVDAQPQPVVFDWPLTHGPSVAAQHPTRRVVDADLVRHFETAAPWLLAGQTDAHTDATGQVPNTSWSWPCSTAIIKSLADLSASLSSIHSTTPADLFKPTHLIKIFHSMHCQLKQLVLNRPRSLLLLNGYRFLVIAAGRSVLHPLVFRSVMDNLLKYVSCRGTTAAACGLLGLLVEQSCIMGVPENLTRNLVRLCGALVQACFGHCLPMAGLVSRSAASEPGRDHDEQTTAITLLDFVLHLASQQPDKSAVNLAVLVLGTHHERLEALAVKYGSGNGKDPAVVVASLLDHGLRSIAPLEHLQHLLDAGPDVSTWLVDGQCSRLAGKLRDIASGREDLSIVTGRSNPDAAATADASENVRVMAAICLAKLSAFMADPCHSGSNGITAAQTAAALHSDWQVAKCYEGCIVAIQHMIAALFDSDLDVVSVATATLSAIFSTDDGRMAFAALAPSDAMYVDLFVPPMEDRTADHPTQQQSQAEARHPKAMAKYPKLAPGLLLVSGRSEQAWAVSIANSLLASYAYVPFFACLGRMMEVYPSLADAVLPYLIHLPLYMELEGVADNQLDHLGSASAAMPVRADLSSQVRDFFDTATVSDAFAVRKILSVLHYLGHCKNAAASLTGRRVAVTHEWLDLDYGRVAASAMHVDPLEALYFAEIDHVKSGRQRTQVERSTWKLVMDCYSALGDANGFQGVVAFYRDDVDAILLQKHVHERDWTKVIANQDAALQRLSWKVGGDGSAARGQDALASFEQRLHLADALGRLGHYHILDLYLGHTATGALPPSAAASAAPTKQTVQQDAADLRFEALWRMGQWDADYSTSPAAASTSSTHGSIFKSLATLKSAPLAPSTAATIGSLLLSVASADDRGRHKAFPALLCLLEADEARQAMHDRLKLDWMLDQWTWRFNQLRQLHKFATIEPLLACRSRLLEIMHHAMQGQLDRTSSADLCSKVVAYASSLSIDIVRLATGSSDMKACRLALPRLVELMPYMDAWQALEARLQRLKVHWLDGDHDIAIGLLDDLMAASRATAAMEGSTPHHRAEHAGRMFLLGKWLSKSQATNPHAIIKQYYLPATDTLRLLVSDELVALRAQRKQQQQQPPQQQRSSQQLHEYDPEHLIMGRNNSEFFHLAHFCDTLLQEMQADETHKRSAQLLREREAELRQMTELEKTTTASRASAASGALDPDVQRYKRRLVKQIQVDQMEAERIRKDMSDYLILSIKSYIKALIYSNKRIEESVFRFCSLWFANAGNADALVAVGRYLPHLPTRKFLVLMYQISARILSAYPAAVRTNANASSGSGGNEQSTPSESRFYALLEDLILRILRDYPFHSVPHLLALKNGSDAQPVAAAAAAPAATGRRSGGNTSTRRSSRGKTADDDQGPRFNPAQLILNKLAMLDNGSSGTGPGLSGIVQSMDQLFGLYMQVANLRPDKTVSKATAGGRSSSSRSFSFDHRMAISCFTESSLTPVLTVEQPVGLPRDYGNIVHITGFESTYTLPGGINVPKVVQCHGSDGKCYKQLVKGNDDLRQDAVLSSIFNMLNILLTKNTSTQQQGSRSTSLRIRTYTIIPMSPQAGVLQWVDGTVPLGTLLADAHSRYHPTDWPTAECRRLMALEHERDTSTVASKLDVFTAIHKHFSPVLGRVLADWYTADAREWYTRRQRFAQSVATSSMVGFVVGLGDRHAQNILMDRATAEVVHIDLGVAFDQGRLLTVPELVPFRLTQDLVDGLGITGTKGCFQRACEETLRVLRTEAHAIWTLLDVFRHDPLYSWRISPIKLRNVQYTTATTTANGSSHGEALLADPRGPDEYACAADGLAPSGHGKSAASEEAERALFGVRKKLQSTLSIECQVSQLISAATDPSNLCRLFPGWQSWM